MLLANGRCVFLTTVNGLAFCTSTYRLLRVLGFPLERPDEFHWSIDECWRSDVFSLDLIHGASSYSCASDTNCMACSVVLFVEVSSSVERAANVFIMISACGVLLLLSAHVQFVRTVGRFARCL